MKDLNLKVHTVILSTLKSCTEINSTSEKNMFKIMDAHHKKRLQSNPNIKELLKRVCCVMMAAVLKSHDQSNINHLYSNTPVLFNMLA